MQYYEAADVGGEVEIGFASLLDCTFAEKTNLLEEPVGTIRAKKKTLAVDTQGYAIKTLKLDIKTTKPRAK